MKRLAVWLTSIALTFGVGVATSTIYKPPLVRVTPEEPRNEDGGKVFSALVNSGANDAAPGIRLTMTSAGHNAREIKLENLGSQPIVKYTIGLGSPHFEGFRSTTKGMAERENFVLGPGASATTRVRALPAERLTTWVDFVEFADGTRWGPNWVGSAERLATVYLPEEVVERLTEEAEAAGQPVHEYARRVLEAELEEAARWRAVRPTGKQRYIRRASCCGG